MLGQDLKWGVFPIATHAPAHDWVSKPNRLPNFSRITVSSFFTGCFWSKLVNLYMFIVQVPMSSFIDIRFVALITCRATVRRLSLCALDFFLWLVWVVGVTGQKAIQVIWDLYGHATFLLGRTLMHSRHTEEMVAASSSIFFKTYIQTLHWLLQIVFWMVIPMHVLLW